MAVNPPKFRVEGVALIVTLRRHDRLCAHDLGARIGIAWVLNSWSSRTIRMPGGGISAACRLASRRPPPSCTN
jgi:hypothetical protein